MPEMVLYTRLEGTKKLARTLFRYSKITVRDIRRLIRKTADQLEADMVSDAAADSGELYTSIGQATLRRAGQWRGRQVEVNAPYALWVHQGVWKEGSQAKASMPAWGPGTPLAEWSERHGIPSYIVARSIASKEDHPRGTKPRPFVTQHVDAKRRPFSLAAQRILFVDAPRKALSNA